MTWLDSYTGDGSRPGDVRGPCKRGAGAPEVLRVEHGDASVKYTNFMFGELDSTYIAEHTAKPAAAKQPGMPSPGPPQPAEPQPAPAPSLGGAAFSQCGSKTWTGSTTCQPGCTCIASGEYYSQCTPPAGAWSCGMAAVDASSPRKASISRQRRLRARRENMMLQWLAEKTKRDAAADRS